MLPTAKYRDVISSVSRLVGLRTWNYRGSSISPQVWLEALLLTESAGDPKAVRYEPHQDTAGRKERERDPDQSGKDDGMLEDDKSYGLMQVMGYNIRRMCGVPDGTQMNFGFALLPLTNISFGLRVLLGELSAVNGNIERALARYNGGPTGDNIQPNGMMRRQVYVDKVYANCVLVSKDIVGG